VNVHMYDVKVYLSAHLNCWKVKQCSCNWWGRIL